MENKLYKLYLKEADSFSWFNALDQDSMRVLLLATWQIILWNPTNLEQTLLRFYGHLIDGPNVLRFLATLKLRLKSCEAYAWAVPNKEAIDTLREHSPIVEIGAGRGYWAALAASAGSDIIAFDEHPPVQGGVNNWHRLPGMFFHVTQAGAEIAGAHPDRTLFLCWPPTRTDAAQRALSSYKGQTVIYVGDEGHDAGTPQFYSELSAGFDRVKVVDIPRWPGIGDRMEVWRRRDLASRTS